MEMIKLHCRDCDGAGWNKYVGEDYRRTCLTCEGTGIEKITKAEYELWKKRKSEEEKRRLEEEERIEKERAARWAKENEERRRKVKEYSPSIWEIFGTALEFAVRTFLTVGVFVGVVRCIYFEGRLGIFAALETIFYTALTCAVVGAIVGVFIKLR